MDNPPAQKLNGRPIQDTLPAHRCFFVPEWQLSALEAEQLTAHTLAQSIQLGSTVTLQNPRTNL